MRAWLWRCYPTLEYFTLHSILEICMDIGVDGRKKSLFFFLQNSGDLNFFLYPHSELVKNRREVEHVSVVAVFRCAAQG